MFNPIYHVYTNLRHQGTMATKLRMVARIIWVPQYETAMCHQPFEVAYKLLRNLYTLAIDPYFMCDVIIDSNIMRTFMILKKLRLDFQFFSKNQEEQGKSISHLYSSS